MRALFFSIAAICLLGGCDLESGSDQPKLAKNTPESAFNLTTQQKATFERTCGVCHGVSGTGAPAPHDAEAWEPRNAQGMEVLLDHTINGFAAMPPMGMCMECSQEDFATFIQFMSGMECEE